MLEFRKKQRADPALERAARKNELEVDVDQVQIEHLASGGLFKDIFLAGDLYGIYEDLFGTDTMFIPSKDLQILYDYDDEYVTPVFRGIPYFHAIFPRRFCPFLYLWGKIYDYCWYIQMMMND